MEPHRPRQERAERTRAHIVDTAAVAFAEHGFDGVSLNDIVSASGISKGAFYFHFSSKEELALAAFRAKQQEMLSKLAAQPTRSSRAELLVSSMRTRAQLIREDPSFRCISRLGAQFNLQSASGSVYASYLDQAIGSIAELIEDGQRVGEFRADLDPDAAARVIFAGAVGIDSLAQVSSGEKDLESRVDELIDLVLHGLLNTSERNDGHERIESEFEARRAKEEAGR
jgi:AcrR family transcriptional regulator